MLLQPTSEGEAELRELGSRFFGYAYPAHSQEDVDRQLEQLAKRYPDATHICYAYRLGTTGDDFRAADNGEPKYSAGMPILNQIRSAGLTNVLVAVVRYYGGTKLGVPGLVKAYGGAAADAMAGLSTEEALDAFEHRFTVSPARAGIVYDLARKAGLSAMLEEMRADGGQVIRIFGYGDQSALVKRIEGRLVG